MKKYKKLTNDLFNDEKLIQLLEDEAKNGWFLKGTSEFYLTFRKDEPKNLKYQIDYNKITDEYKNVLKQLGYHFVCGYGYEGGMIYYNEDIHAEDLYSDEQTRLMSIIYNYRPSVIISNAFTTLLRMLMVYIFYKDIYYSSYPFSIYNFFINTTRYLFILFWTFSFILDFIKTIYLITMYRYYSKQLNHPYSFQPVNYQVINTYRILSAVDTITIFPILTICLIAVFIDLPAVFYLDLGIILILIAILIYTHAYKKVAIISIIILLPLSIFSYDSYSIPDNKPLYYNNNFEKDYINTTNSIFSRSISTYIFEEQNYENNINALNEDIAEILFKGEIISLDRNYRKNKLIDEYQKIGKDYDENDYPYLSFEQALQNMKELHHPLVDQAYYNDNYVICIKDKQVVSFQYSSPDQMNTIIEYYFK